MQDLGRRADTRCILLDCDCIWTKHDPHLNRLIASGKLVLYDIFERARTDGHPHGLSRLAMGRLFLQIEKDYPKVDPVWYGGEVTGWSSQTF
jgi:hypothetical protein